MIPLFKYLSLSFCHLPFSSFSQPLSLIPLFPYLPLFSYPFHCTFPAPLLLPLPLSLSLQIYFIHLSSPSFILRLYPLSPLPPSSAVSPAGSQDSSRRLEVGG